MGYRGRPGLSPVTATLVALGELQEGDLTLDIGCGDGTETLALAARGVPTVGVDWYGIAEAQERARRETLERQAMFARVSAFRLSGAFAPATFDAALDTLVYNNIVARHGWKAGERYLAEVAKVLRPNGLFAMAWRVEPRTLDRGPDDLDRELPRRFFRDFDAGPTVFTHLPTRPAGARDRGFASIGLVVARRRA